MTERQRRPKVPWQTEVGTGADFDPRLAAGALGWLFLAGASIGLLSLLLPHPPRANVGGLWSNVALAYAGGLVLLAGASHIRVWMLHGALVFGTLVIARAVLLSHEQDSFYSVWFIWVGLYAFYFFGRRLAAAHVTFSSLVYAATLVRDPPTSPVARWLTTVATLLVACGFIDTLVRRARREAGAAAASANSMAQVTELAHELAALSDSRAARRALCSGALRVSGACFAALWEPDSQGSGLTMTASSEETLEARAIPFVGQPHHAIEAFATGRPSTSVAGAEPPGDVPNRPGAMTLWQPLGRDQRTVGVLELGFPDPVARDDPSAVVLTDLLAVEAAVTLQRVTLLSELETKARTDELTGLPNRRQWHEHLPRLLTTAGRIEATISLAMIDLDHFKHFNDTNGHQAGDRLLKQVAGAWTAELRPGDLLVRYGGEEFALALPQCEMADALEIVERLRKLVPDGQSCSAGIVSWDGTESAAELIGRADDALYQAKGAGRNRSVTATVA